MKKQYVFLFTTLLLAGILSACTSTPTVKPDLFLEVPSPLTQGTQTDIFIRIDNPENNTIQDAKLMIGYAREGDSGIVQISEIPLSLSEGESFKQYVPWKIDFQPVQGGHYQVYLILLSADNTELAQVSAEVEFTEPQVSVSINTPQLAQNDQALIQVQVNNTADVAMQDYTLSIGYGEENDISMILIQEMAINLQPGETFAQEIPWLVDYVPASGAYEIRAVLLMQGSIFVAQAETPVILTAP